MSFSGKGLFCFRHCSVKSWFSFFPVLDFGVGETKKETGFRQGLYLQAVFSTLEKLGTTRHDIWTRTKYVVISILRIAMLLLLLLLLFFVISKLVIKTDLSEPKWKSYYEKRTLRVFLYFERFSIHLVNIWLHELTKVWGIALIDLIAFLALIAMIVFDSSRSWNIFILVWFVDEINFQCLFCQH